MLIQINGLCDADNMREIEKMGVDVVGFDFRKDSERMVKMISSRAGIIPDYSRERIKRLKANKDINEFAQENSCRRMGCFADDMPQNIVTRVYNYNLDIVELWGEELPLMIDNLRNTLHPDIHPNIKIAKHCSVSTIADVENLRQYADSADYLAISITEEALQGNVMSHYDCKLGFVLVYGSKNNSDSIINLLSHEKCMGICIDDVFEDAIGVKNTDQLKAFLDRIN